MAPHDEYLTPTQFAARISMSIRTIRTYVATGTVEAYRLRDRSDIRIPSRAVNAVLVPIPRPKRRKKI